MLSEQTHGLQQHHVGAIEAFAYKRKRRQMGVEADMLAQTVDEVLLYLFPPVHVLGGNHKRDTGMAVFIICCFCMQLLDGDLFFFQVIQDTLKIGDGIVTVDPNPVTGFWPYSRGYSWSSHGGHYYSYLIGLSLCRGDHTGDLF